jgi:hypothetical protein
VFYFEWKIRLKEVGLSKYIDKFEEEEFTFVDDWPNMEDADLVDMGMKKGSIKRFRKTFTRALVIQIFFDKGLQSCSASHLEITLHENVPIHNSVTKKQNISPRLIGILNTTLQICQCFETQDFTLFSFLRLTRKKKLFQ